MVFSDCKSSFCSLILQPFVIMASNGALFMPVDYVEYIHLQFRRIIVTPGSIKCWTIRPICPELLKCIQWPGSSSVRAARSESKNGFNFK